MGMALNGFLSIISYSKGEMLTYLWFKYVNREAKNKKKLNKLLSLSLSLSVNKYFFEMKLIFI